MRRLFSIVALLALVGCSGTTSSDQTLPVTTVTLHGSQGPIHVSVEEANSPAEREQGLMGRTSLGANEGMVFKFGDVADGPVTTTFWMKNTLIPLSIAFWDAVGKIVAIRDMEPCETDTCTSYGSPTPYVGALEVNQGFFEEHGIREGDRIDLTR
jgi:uncharacterized membrane protein (UPF0127 family)